MPDTCATLGGNNMPEYFDTPWDGLFLTLQSRFYSDFAQPVGWLALRIIIGGMFMMEGRHKIQHPMAQLGFVVEMIGSGLG